MSSEELSRNGKAAAGLIAKAAAVFAAGWMARTIIVPAEASEARPDRIERIETTVRKLDKNMARVMDKLGIDERP